MIHLTHLQQLLSDIYGCNITPSSLQYCILISTADPSPILLAYLWCSNDLPECTYKDINVITHECCNADTVCDRKLAAP